MGNTSAAEHDNIVHLLELVSSPELLQNMKHFAMKVLEDAADVVLDERLSCCNQVASYCTAQRLTSDPSMLAGL